VPQLIFRNSSKVKGSKVKVTRQLNAVTENKPYLQNGKACKSPLAGVGYIVAAELQAEQFVVLECAVCGDANPRRLERQSCSG